MQKHQIYTDTLITYTGVLLILYKNMIKETGFSYFKRNRCIYHITPYYLRILRLFDNNYQSLFDTHVRVYTIQSNLKTKQFRFFLISLLIKNTVLILLRR